MPQLEASIGKADFMALRKINITNWRTPVVKQYRIRSVPFCMVYDEKGKVKLSSSKACWLLAEDPKTVR